MTNVTLSVDEEALKRARIHALEQGTSLNAVIREFLNEYARGQNRYQRMTERILKHARASSADSKGVQWNRDQLYER